MTYNDQEVSEMVEYLSFLITPAPRVAVKDVPSLRPELRDKIVTSYREERGDFG